MSTKKVFSPEEIATLRANPYTEQVTAEQISFTLAFKKEFWRLSIEGCTGNIAFRKLGYNPEVLGFERVHKITKRIRRAAKTPEGLKGKATSRMRVSKEHFNSAQLENRNSDESQKDPAAHAEIQTLLPHSQGKSISQAAEDHPDKQYGEKSGKP